MWSGTGRRADAQELHADGPAPGHVTPAAAKPQTATVEGDDLEGLLNETLSVDAPPPVLVREFTAAPFFCVSPSYGRLKVPNQNPGQGPPRPR